VVEVSHECSHGLTGAFCAFDFERERLFQAVPISNSSELVSHCSFEDLCFALMQLEVRLGEFHLSVGILAVQFEDHGVQAFKFLYIVFGENPEVLADSTNPGAQRLSHAEIVAHREQATVDLAIRADR